MWSIDISFSKIQNIHSFINIQLISVFNQRIDLDVYHYVLELGEQIHVTFPTWRSAQQDDRYRTRCSFLRWFSFRAQEQRETYDLFRCEQRERRMRPWSRSSRNSQNWRRTRRNVAHFCHPLGLRSTTL